jgi:hypothetical protein
MASLPAAKSPRIYDATAKENGRTLTLKCGDSVRVVLPAGDRRWGVGGVNVVAYSSREQSQGVEGAVFTAKQIGVGQLIGQLGDEKFTLNLKVI